MTKVMLIVEMIDGSIELRRSEVGGGSNPVVSILDVDESDRARVKRVLGNWSWYPDWLKLTPEQEAACVESTGKVH